LASLIAFFVALAAAGTLAPTLVVDVVLVAVLLTVLIGVDECSRLTRTTSRWSMAEADCPPEAWIVVESTTLVELLGGLGQS
jgi:hypothetical protein